MARFREAGELTSIWVRVPDTRNYTGRRKAHRNRGKHASPKPMRSSVLFALGVFSLLSCSIYAILT